MLEFLPAPYRKPPLDDFLNIPAPCGKTCYQCVFSSMSIEMKITFSFLLNFPHDVHYILEYFGKSTVSKLAGYERKITKIAIIQYPLELKKKR